MPKIWGAHNDPWDNLIDAMFRYGLRSARKGNQEDHDWILVAGPQVVEALGYGDWDGEAILARF